MATYLFRHAEVVRHGSEVVVVRCQIDWVSHDPAGNPTQHALELELDGESFGAFQPNADLVAEVTGTGGIDDQLGALPSLDVYPGPCVEFHFYAGTLTTVPDPGHAAHPLLRVEVTNPSLTFTAPADPTEVFPPGVTVGMVLKSQASRMSGRPPDGAQNGPHSPR